MRPPFTAGWSRTSFVSIDDEPAGPAREFRPYIPSRAHLRELTWAPLVVGTVLGVVFGASSLYLVLKVGLTVSASIPVAVISITFFRLLAKLGVRQATILENNITQTAGSAGESIAFGIGVTMPAIMILGFDLEITRVILVAVLGGLLGILMMVPLRRALIVEQHDQLKYPEGTACAEVLKAAASEESRAAAADGNADASIARASDAGAGAIFGGFAIGVAYKTVMVALRGWKDVPEKIFGAPLKAASISAEISPELLGVGYIIGPLVAARMCGGGVLAYLVLIPAIKFFGEGMGRPLSPGTVLIRDMGPGQIRGAYVLYIGAGAVAAGGIISLARSLPTIWQSIKSGWQDVRASRKAAAAEQRPRTDQDLPMQVVLLGSLALVVAIAVAAPLHMNIGGAVLIVVFGFLFATVSSRLTGEIGSSSNPISGMTVATLLLTCAIFLVLGWTGPGYYVTALSVGAIVCIAASNAGTTSQDLKTGFLVGATPRLQQIAILVGALVSALALGPILLRLNEAATVYVPQVTTERVEVDGRVVDRSTENFSADLRADAKDLGDRERLTGPQARSDANAYRVWQREGDAQGPAGRYLVDDAGRPVYLVDPGINGTHATRPDGTKVLKFDAPKATLMSYIIKGILNRQLPWGLVLLGVMISVVLEMSSIPSLAFAVGLYLPLSSSTPIFVGGAIRWLVDRYLRGKGKNAELTEEELAAEGDKSPGVLMASGYIAGGAIAGIGIAFLAGVLSDTQSRIDTWSAAHNPFYGGDSADLFSMAPFAVITVLLYLAGREKLWAGRGPSSSG
jgi:putative OPT family oligopeptide transporter